MEFQGLIPVIQCKQIEQTLAFYQQAFRYIIINKTITDDGLQWAYLKSDNTYLMLQKKIVDNASSNECDEIDNNSDLSGNIILHYYTSDITAQHRFMTAKGFKVGEIENTPYHISQFYIKDPEGNTIAVGQDSNKTISQGSSDQHNKKREVPVS